MFCPNCGKTVPNDVNYCAYCGTPLKDDLTPRSTAKVEWEICEIEEKKIKQGSLFGKGPENVFIVKAIGPEGVNIIKQSRTFNLTPSIHNPSDSYVQNEMKKWSEICVATLNTIISELTTDGWEPVAEKGTYWYSYKFRRPVSK